jgi:hypothetical protein
MRRTVQRVLCSASIFPGFLLILSLLSLAVTFAGENALRIRGVRRGGGAWSKGEDTAVGKMIDLTEDSPDNKNKRTAAVKPRPNPSPVLQAPPNGRVLQPARSTARAGAAVPIFAAASKWVLVEGDDCKVFARTLELTHRHVLPAGLEFTTTGNALT